MINKRIDNPMFQEKNNLRRRAKFGTFLYSDPSISTDENDVNIYTHRKSNASVPSPYEMSPNNSSSGNSSPYSMSPFHNSSPYINSPWIHTTPLSPLNDVTYLHHRLIGSLVREEGHIYSLAASGDLLFTGSDSRNIRVWKNLKEFSGFKSNSGLVKAIVVSGNRIFTGHQDGKIRVWRFLSNKHNSSYKRIGNLPTTFEYMKSSINPKSYVEVRRRRNVPWIRHYDAVSCMCLDEEQGLLYSGSWDKTYKVWRLSDSKCLESVTAHDDAVNSIVVSSGFLFTGSADGRVKVWRRELVGKTTTHVLVQTMLKLECAVTSLAVNSAAGVVYSGSSDGLVNYCEREKHFLTHSGVLRGHKLAVLCLAAAGDLVMSGSADKSICVWRRETGGDHTCLSVLTGHSGPVKCLAVEEDRQDDDTEDYEDYNQRWILYSGSLDKSVKIWRVSNDAPELKQLEAM
ncbi:hypothetical protein LguiA_027456 [Lonicera macranthoides]